jgi:HK97 family phage major capsid protein
MSSIVLQLRQAKGLAVDKLNEPDVIKDSKLFAEIEAQIADLDQQIERAEKAIRLSSESALLVKDQPGLGVRLEPRYRRDGRMISFPNTKEGEADAYRTGMFVKAVFLGDEKAQAWCRENGVMLMRAQSEGVNSAGGFLVPEEMMNSIIVLRETYGVFRREARIVPMGRDTLNWPRRTGGLTAYFVGENTAPTESQAAWDNVNLTAKKLATLTRFSTEIDQDAIISIGDWITSEIAYAFASKEDDCGFNGDGTSAYGGITGVTQKFLNASSPVGLSTATGHTTFDAVTATDVESMRALLPFYALPGAKIYCSQYAFALLFERLVAAGGGNTIQTLDGEVQYRYLGTPITIVQKMVSTSPSGKIGLIYGNMGLAAAMGERRGITIMRSEHRYMDQDQIGLLGTERFDINVHDIGDNTVAGPIVAMKMG